MSTKSTLDKWQEYVEFQKMVSVIGRQTTMIFDGLIELADENGYDRVDTVNMFCDMFEAILETIDPDEYDPDEHASLMN